MCRNEKDINIAFTGGQLWPQNSRDRSIGRALTTDDKCGRIIVIRTCEEIVSVPKNRAEISFRMMKFPFLKLVSAPSYDIFDVHLGRLYILVSMEQQYAIKYHASQKIVLLQRCYGPPPPTQHIPTCVWQLESLE